MSEEVKSVSNASNASNESNVAAESFVKSGLASLLKTGLYSDFVIIAGSNEAKETFNVHRCIISMNSDFFKNVCKPDAFKEGNEGRLEFPHITPETMKNVLGFLYAEEYESTNLIAHAQVFVTALYLQLPMLAKSSLAKLSNAIACKTTAQPEPFPTKTQEELLQALEIIYDGSSEQDRQSAGIHGLSANVSARYSSLDSALLVKFYDLVVKHGSLGRDLLQQSIAQPKKVAKFNCTECKADTTNILCCNSCKKCPYLENKKEDMTKACGICWKAKGFYILCFRCKNPKNIV